MLCTLPTTTTTTMTGKIWWEVIEKGKREREEKFMEKFISSRYVVAVKMRRNEEK
jgi:hypothetical protein